MKLSEKLQALIDQCDYFPDCEIAVHVNELKELTSSAAELEAENKRLVDIINTREAWQRVDRAERKLAKALADHKRLRDALERVGDIAEDILCTSITQIVDEALSGGGDAT